MVLADRRQRVCRIRGVKVLPGAMFSSGVLPVLEFLHVRRPLSISPAVDELAHVRRHPELSHDLRVDTPGPLIGLHLDEDDVGRADADAVPVGPENSDRA